MNYTAYFYDFNTGLFNGTYCSSNEILFLQEQISNNFNTAAFISTEYIDYLSKKVNILTNELEEYQPPKPIDTVYTLWTWNTSNLRWVSQSTEEGLIANQWNLIRDTRNQLLANSDWRVIRAMDTGVVLSESWTIYRQTLRDITAQLDPFNITWPEIPL